MSELDRLRPASLSGAMPCDPATQDEPFQSRVGAWMRKCFRPELCADGQERGDRLLEEVFELLQSEGYPPERIAGMLHYVWSRPKGDPSQEVGGVMVTLAAYCQTMGLDLQLAAEAEYARISQPEIIEKIRNKQAGKPVGDALLISSGGERPQGPLDAAAAKMAEAIRSRQERGVAAGGFPLDEEVIEGLEREALQAYDLARAAARTVEAADADEAGKRDLDLGALLPPGVEAWMVADALAGMSRSEGLSRFQKTNASLAERMLRRAMRKSPGSGATDTQVAAAARLVARSIDSDMAAFNRLLDAIDVQPDTPVRHYFAQILESFAALMETAGDSHHGRPTSCGDELIA